MKYVGTTPAAAPDIVPKSYVDSAVTDLLPVPFHLPGAQSTGVKTPQFICPWAGTLTVSRAISGAATTGPTYRLTKNGSATGFTTSSAVGTSVVSTTHNVTVAIGDTIQLEVVTAGTAATDLSVTAVVQVP